MSIKTRFLLEAPRKAGGFTLVEMMLASGIGCLLSLAIIIMTIHMVYSFKAFSNYAESEQETRSANDWLSRDIRQASGVVQTTTNDLTLLITNNLVTYTYYAANHIVTRHTANESKVLLRDCLNVGFTIYQGSSLGAAYGQFVPGTNGAKLVGYYWHCGVTNSDGTVNSTDADSALVVMRN
jgi:prepilin-type N-terminal cleavage/methylation domain-containing protein